MRSLADRMRTYEQQKARLADTEAKLKLAEKRARARRLIETGSLIEKAGLSSFASEALYGALLSLRDSAANSKQVEQWAALGARVLAEEAHTRDQSREPIVLTFPATLTKDAVSALRTGGFRFNKVLQHWEGLAEFEEAQELAASQGGIARKVASSFSQPVPPNAGSDDKARAEAK